MSALRSVLARRVLAGGRDRGTSLAELVVVVVLVGLVGTSVMTLSISTGRLLGRSTERAEQSQTSRTALEAVARALRTADDPDDGAAPGAVCSQASTTGARCAFVDATSPYPELRSGPTQVAFFSSLYDLNASRAGKRVLYRYFVDGGGVLWEWYWEDPDITGSSAVLAPPLRTRALARGLATGTGVPPVFTYLNGAQATGVTTDAPPAWPNALTDPTGVNDSPLLQAADIGTGAVDAPGQVRRGLVAVEVWLSFVRSTDARRVTVAERVTLPNDPEVITT